MSSTSKRTYAQFCRLETACAKETRSLGKAPREKRIDGQIRWTVGDLLDEADRKTSHCRHVKDPRKPTWTIGSAAKVLGRSREWYSQARQADGKKLRNTSPVMVAGVVSFPRARERDWAAYREDVVAYFRERHQDRLVGVVEHLDEANQHLHIYLIPRDGEGIGAVHPGRAASDAAGKLPGNFTRSAFKRAMKIWQDEMFQGAGQAHGLTRLGSDPSRVRMRRDQYDAQTNRTRSEKILADAEAKAAEIVEKAKGLRESVVNEIRQVAEMNAENERFAELVRNRAERLDNTAAGAQEIKIKQLQAVVDKQKAELDEALFIMKQYRLRDAARDPIPMVPVAPGSTWVKPAPGI